MPTGKVGAGGGLVERVSKSDLSMHGGPRVGTERSHTACRLRFVGSGGAQTVFARYAFNAAFEAFLALPAP